MRALESLYTVITPIGTISSRYYFDNVDSARMAGYILYYRSPTVYVFLRPHPHDPLLRYAFVFRGLSAAAAGTGGNGF